MTPSSTLITDCMLTKASAVPVHKQALWSVISCPLLGGVGFFLHHMRVELLKLREPSTQVSVIQNLNLQCSKTLAAAPYSLVQAGLMGSVQGTKWNRDMPSTLFGSAPSPGA